MPEPKYKRAPLILNLLKKAYPDSGTSLDYKNPLQLLISTMLSAQCTDKRVNSITPALFKKYKTAEDFANARQPELETLIHSTGFYRSKAKNIIGACKKIEKEFGGKVPMDMPSLISLPGVGRKTANIVLSNYGVIEGIAVDTHVRRLSKLLGLTKSKNPQIIERDLMSVFPKKEWGRINGLLVWHGRKICIARRPKCKECTLNKLCPSASPRKGSL